MEGKCVRIDTEHLFPEIKEVEKVLKRGVKGRIPSSKDLKKRYNAIRKLVELVLDLKEIEYKLCSSDYHRDFCLLIGPNELSLSWCYHAALTDTWFAEILLPGDKRKIFHSYNEFLDFDFSTL